MVYALAGKQNHMATESQLIANRSNALASTGPVTDQGKSRVSRNALTSGLFSTTDFVLPDEREIYTEFRASYEADLAPIGAIEQTFAAEIIHAAWRLRRCSTLESALRLKDGPCRIEETQKSVERARAAAFRIFTRSLTELRKLQTERKRTTPVITKQTQSDPAPAPTPIALTPRGAPCTCGSGIKFKRCCGKDAPPVINTSHGTPLGQAA
jgi:hypothetical protein